MRKVSILPIGLLLVFLTVLITGNASAKPLVVEDSYCDELDKDANICFYYKTFTNDVVTNSGNNIENLQFQVIWEIVNIHGEVTDKGKYSQTINENNKTSIEIIRNAIGYDETRIIELFNQILKRLNGEIQFNKGRIKEL